MKYKRDIKSFVYTPYKDVNATFSCFLWRLYTSCSKLHTAKYELNT